MKKLFIFLMCLIGYISSISAQEIEHYVGAGSTRTYSSFPVYENYNYSMREYIYLAEEMGDGALIGDITSIAFLEAENRIDTRKFSVYIVHTDKANFAGFKDWIPFTEDDCYLKSADVQYLGKDQWAVLNLDKPFKYEGGNIAIGIFDETGSFNHYSKFYSYRTKQLRRNLGHDRDSAPYNPLKPGVFGSYGPFIGRDEMPVTRFTFKSENDYSIISVEPKEIDLGYRPNNAWMRPYEVTIGTKGNALTVSAVDVTNSYFALSEVETPASITFAEPMVLELSHTSGSGEIEGQVAISVDIARTLELVDVKATAYNPVASDVWELAESITSYPFTATPDLTNIYPNYLLPGNSENGKDVVYELNFNSDVALIANVNGTNGKIAVYAEGFNGEGGPMEDNNYVGINPVNSVITENSIDGLGLPAGKYYLVASSTSDFTVNVDVEAIPLPEKAFNPTPADFSQNVSNPTLEWEFGEYTVEYQLLFGSTYPPEEVLVDWTDNLETAYSVTDLNNNTNYFWRVNARNSSGITYGDIWGFTTPLLVPQNLTVLDKNIYEGETSTIVWEGVTNRSHLGYNVYVEYYNEYIKKNTTPIQDTTFVITGLSYCMDPGYRALVTAVYDEGESNYSDSYDAYIKVTGMGSVAGVVYEQDEITPVTTGGIVMIEGKDEHGTQQSYTFPVDENGSFTGEVLAGNYTITSVMEGYMNQTERCKVTYDNTTNINISIREVYNPVKYIKAKENEDVVNVEWGMQFYGNAGDDFETGDFSMNEWNNEVSSYPWAVTEDAYEGSYAMKSTCEGVGSGVSAIEITVEVPYDAVVSFYHKVSSESGWDYGYFYIDGALMGNASGEIDWAYKEFRVAEGVHTYRWEYAKDGSYDNGSDAYFVDNVILYQEPEPFTGGWITYDDGMYATCIGLGTPGPVYWGAIFPYASEYVGYTIDKLSMFDSPDSGIAGTANATANVYLGGTTGPETLVSTTAFTMTGCNDYVEVELETPVAVDGTQPVWVVFYCDELAYPAAACNHTGDPNSDWLSLDGIAWDHSPNFGVSYTWMVAAHLSNAKGQTAMLTTSSKAPKFEGGASTGEFVANADATPRFVGSVAGETETMNEGTRAFASYNLYRKNIHTDEVVKLLDQTSDTTYIDNEWTSIEAGVYQWGASAMYEGNRSVAPYFAEGFENPTIPEGWTLYNTSAPGQESHIIDRQLWTPVKDKYSNNNRFYPAEGSYFLLGDEDGFLTYQQAWDLEYSIITPEIEILPYSIFTMDYINPSYEWLTNWRTNIEIKFAESIDGPWTSLWSTNNVMTMEWTELEVDLSEYEGKTGYIMFSHTALKDWGWFAGIDNVKITSYYPESEILWSKTIDKDMTTSVVVNAQTDNGDPIKGTKVSFINLIEEGMNFEASIDETGSVTIEDFRKGTYEFTVSKAGYTSDAEGVVVEIWDASEFNAVLTEILASVEGLYVSPTGWAMWKGAAGSGDEFFFDFEDGTLNGFVTIDADGDGYNWNNSMNFITSPGYDNSMAFAYSQSYDNYMGPLYPDNYMVTAEKYALGGSSQLTFYVCAQDESWAAEHYGIAISTTGNTDAADFTTIWEETIGGKSGEGVRSGEKQSAWEQKTIDLSEYAGEEVYIAIRHFNCTDMFYLDIDNVALVNADKSDRALLKYQVLLDGVVENDSVVVPYYQHENLVNGTEYTTTVIASYTMGDSEEMSYTWTKASETMFATVKNLEAVVNDDNEVDLTWTLPSEAVEPGPSETFVYGFESDMEGWTTIDADGDANVWKHSIDFGAHTGSGIVYSESYINYVGPLNPDNYLVSPQKYAVAEGSKISFYACAQDENYPYEHFGVAVSTGDNTSASDFTTISEWTISAKGGRQGDRAMRQSSWTKYEADLSDYAGQEIYVALRHFNCTDQYFLDVDDIEITVTTSADRASKEGNWMYYDNGNCVDGVGGPASFYWGIKLRPAELSQYAPAGLTKVALFDKIETSGEFHIYLGGENAPAELVHTQEYTCTGVNDFTEYELTEVVPVYGSENVWVVFHTNDGVNFPASCCSNTGDADGRWISMDGNTWQDLIDAGLSYTWMIRAYLDDEAMPETPAIAEILGLMIYKNGELVSSKPIAGESYTDKDGVDGDEYCVRVVYGGGIDTTYYGMSSPVCAEAEYIIDCFAPEELTGEYKYNDDGTFGAMLSWNNAAANSNDFDHYNIYRGTNANNMQKLGECTVAEYFDEVGEGTYYYQVTALYSANGEECESDPANAYGSEDNYVIVDVTAIDENGVKGMMVYPNPTQGDLNISAENITRIVITNALGQVMYDQEVNTDNKVVNMSQYEDGVYTVRIVTENGVAIERVTVVR